MEGPSAGLGGVDAAQSGSCRASIWRAPNDIPLARSAAQAVATPPLRIGLFLERPTSFAGGAFVRRTLQRGWNVCSAGRCLEGGAAVLTIAGLESQFAVASRRRASPHSTLSVK